MFNNENTDIIEKRKDKEEVITFVNGIKGCTTLEDLSSVEKELINPIK